MPAHFRIQEGDLVKDLENAKGIRCHDPDRIGVVVNTKYAVTWIEGVESWVI